jgi:hypothetical protein
VGIIKNQGNLLSSQKYLEIYDMNNIHSSFLLRASEKKHRRDYFEEN